MPFVNGYHVDNCKGIGKWLYGKNGYEKIEIGLDHVFKIPGTKKSIVFYPYSIREEKIPEFMDLCEENGYKFQIRAPSEYGFSTLKIILEHEIDSDVKNINWNCTKLLGETEDD
ncbi:hypothetical protein AAA799B03_01096 [Marine Group I thaumarchaeote SCGC AAA799-B03]|uniref:Uncharacterized protein n=1 Tax=Marine Group I thaumarchaeote SCGC AAA799-B03 TaxID=1502289 RepID=A0A087S6L0_9ARCH|nr:hypothetical protein AAA799B03_01096 [Marine Group I thaumarchaeote SCGC AAA799-B03]